MNFTKRQMTAVWQLTSEIAGADGKIDAREPILTVTTILKLGFTPDEGDQIIDAARFMDRQEAIGIVSNLAYSEKKYVAALLTMLMAIDGDVDYREQEILNRLTRECALPIIAIGEAKNYLGF